VVGKKNEGGGRIRTSRFRVTKMYRRETALATVRSKVALDSEQMGSGGRSDVPGLIFMSAAVCMYSGIQVRVKTLPVHSFFFCLDRIGRRGSPASSVAVVTVTIYTIID
jgi:hypothetical protein